MEVQDLPFHSIDLVMGKDGADTKVILDDAKQRQVGGLKSRPRTRLFETRFSLRVVKLEPAKKAAQEKEETREVENAGPEEKSLANSLADLGNPWFDA